jgi:phosphatidylinositol alpha-1,6-mannosyltransferase
MKTLLITLDFFPATGGVARYLQHLAEYFSDRLFVLAPSCRQDTQEAFSFSFFREPLFYQWFWPRWLKSVFLLWRKRSQYDQVLVSHLLPLGTVAWLAKICTHKPYLLIVHGMDVRLACAHPLKRWLAKQVIKQAKVVIANSQSLMREVQQHFSPPQIRVVYPCVDATFLSPAPDRPIHLSRPLHLLTVSRLVPRKGHTFVLEALQRLKGEGKSVEYKIYGDGPELSHLRSLVSSYGLETFVTFQGQVSDQTLLEAYRWADVFVMPVKEDGKDKEGFGIVYIEAAAQGLPSIASCISGVDEAVLDKETGILIAPGDVDALCEAMRDAIIHPEPWRLYGQKAKERARREFVAQEQYKKLEPFL